MKFVTRVFHPFIREVASFFKGLSPARILVVGFIFIQLVGTVLLYLPIANNNPLNLIDAFFTATSALCVTGLTVKNTLYQWSPFGKILIMMLIEIGGLGFMTIITLFFIFVGKRITLKERLIIRESLNQLNYNGIVAFVKRIFYWVLVIQTIGALVLFVRFLFCGMNFSWALFLGVFHSISAYCNAGFDMIGMDSLSPYAGDFVVNITIMALILLGGLGYTVMADVLHVFSDLSYKKLSLSKEFDRLKLHSKIVIATNVILLASGFLLYLLYEWKNPGTLLNLSWPTKFLAAMFQSVTTRTAGFFTISQKNLSIGSKLVTIFLMFIGGSPGSTAGGIKTIAFAVLVLYIVSAVKGKSNIEIFDRTIPMEILQRSMTVAGLNLITILISTQIISSLNPQFDFIDVLYEITSAVGTVGLGVGVCDKVSAFCKFIICIDMMIGKIGPTSVVVALITRNKDTSGAVICYPQEKVIVG